MQVVYRKRCQVRTFKYVILTITSNFDIERHVFDHQPASVEDRQKKKRNIEREREEKEKPNERLNRPPFPRRP